MIRWSGNALGYVVGVGISSENWRVGPLQEGSEMTMTII